MPINQQGKTYEEVYGKTPTINSTTLQQTTPLQLPPTPQETPYDVSAIPLAELTADLNQPTQAEKTQDDLSSRFLTAIQSMGGKAQAQQQEEQARGLPAQQQQLTDINSQLLTLQNEAKAIPLKLQEQAQGRGITAGGLQPIQAAELRKNAINALSLSSVAQALQGNIALAQQQADRAVEVKFAPIENEIKFLKEALSLNESRLAREDKQKTVKLQLKIAERERLLEQGREDQKLIMGWAAEAAKLGNAPSVVVNNALKAKTPFEALSILSPYMVDQNEKAQALLDLELSRERIKSEQVDREIARLKANNDTKLTNAQIDKIRAEISSPKQPDAKEFQYKANLFAQRMSQANDILAANEAQVVSSDAGQYSAKSFFENTTIGNQFAGELVQSQRQAERNFLNSVLRRESGAVISPTEFAEGARQYFPRPGDSEEVLAQKRQNRSTVIQSLQQEAGAAFTSAPQQLSAKVYELNGKQYVQGPDGLFYQK